MQQFNGKVSSAGLMKMEKIASLRRMQASFLSAAARCHWRDQPETARWLVLAIDGRKAQAVRDFLEESDIETLMPMEKKVVIHRVTRQEITRERPLFPGYLMVRCVVGPAAIVGLGNVDGVHRVLHMVNGYPYIVSDDVAFRFSNLSNEADVIDEEADRISAGDFVEVVSGPFTGIRAHIKRIDKRKRQAIIKTTMFSGKLDIPIPLAFVEKL